MSARVPEWYAEVCDVGCQLTFKSGMRHVSHKVINDPVVVVPSFEYYTVCHQTRITSGYHVGRLTVESVMKQICRPLLCPSCFEDELRRIDVLRSEAFV